jgi:hypothetical protein
MSQLTTLTQVCRFETDDGCFSSLIILKSAGLGIYVEITDIYTSSVRSEGGAQNFGVGFN